MEKNQTKKLRYLIKTERNGYGKEVYYAKLCFPWYRAGFLYFDDGKIERWNEFGMTECFFDREELIEAIRRDAERRRTEHLDKFKTVSIEPFDA